MAKKKIEEVPKKIYLSFLAYLKENLGKLLARFGKKILVAIIAIGLTIGIIYAVFGLIGYLKSSKSASDNLQSQTSAPAGPPASPTENLQNNSESFVPPPATTSSPNASPEKSITPSVEKPIFVTIKKTPTGWLNVRQEPSKNSEIIDKVDSGEKIEAIGLKEAKAGEKFGWYRIVLSDGKTGWVYGEYVQIVIDE